MRFVRRVAVVVACVPVLVLAGCGDDESAGEPVELPSLSPSVPESPSVSGALGVEELPASEVEPEEFVRAWVDAYSELVLTGDGTRLRAISADSCSGCDEVTGAYEAIYQAGGSIKTDGEPNTVTAVVADEATENGVRLVVDFTSAPGRATKSAGSDEVEFDATASSWVLDLDSSAGNWRVLRLAVEG
ncbi:DUF6318 family protein [Nocardioides sp. AE5]|uniref:DUF6318 family protein n=1 Tax=Nocardioides sp. AE5 TaxID=2962573 RepID=UPI002881AA44|nr:DUF6318 family protein [Nocardioides sp. AE5]MDT0201092.1 DUF6318 family protein [Nocardioides sp. AE5]